jgi:pimeloyl-ACP methyl ester carboxylesterase
MKNRYKLIAAILCFLFIIYLIGPSPSTPKLSTTLPTVPAAPSALEAYIITKEAQHKIKPNNQARIVWANDSLRIPTEYAIVYLHGFSASQEEGNPVHRAIAKEFGCNLYLSRLAEHGIDTTDQLINFTADKLWESAKEALVIGSRLGKKIILMGTSTGGTLALQLAATYPEKVAALVLYSPNIEINDPAAFLINNPWGLQIARMVKGGKYLTPPVHTKLYLQYWNSPYRLEAAAELEELLESTMNRGTFKKIHQPTLALYYYKSEQEQDPVVKVSAIKTMIQDIATPKNQKRELALPSVGDHVLASPIRSKDPESVKMQTEKFLKEILLLNQK